MQEVRITRSILPSIHKSWERTQTCVIQYSMIRSEDSIELLLISAVQLRGNTSVNTFPLSRPTMTASNSPLVFWPLVWPNSVSDSDVHFKHVLAHLPATKEAAVPPGLHLLKWAVLRAVSSRSGLTAGYPDLHRPWAKCSADFPPSYHFLFPYV